MAKVKTRDIRMIEIKDADRLLKFNTHPAQQPRFRRRHVEFLISEIKKRRFREGEISLALCVFDGNRKILVNGQHQLTAVSESGQPIMATYCEYEVFNEGDLAELYRTFDINYQRSVKNLLMAEMQALEVDWHPTVGILVLSAGCEINNLIQKPKNERVARLRDYIKEGDFINEIISPNGTLPAKEIAHIRRVPVIKAMMLTWQKSQSDAMKFWLMVRDGEGLNKQMPAHRLRDFLQTHSIHGGRVGNPARVVTGHEMTSRCMVAWNAFRKGTPTDLKYIPNNPVPKAL